MRQTIELPSGYFDRRVVKYLDYYIVGCVLVLYLLSLALIDSATRDVPGHYYLKKQILLVGLAAVALAAGTFINLDDLVGLGWYLYGGTVLMLAAVFVVGKSVMGSTRWISLGVFDFQPSEVAKLTTILFLAHMADRRERTPRTFWDLVLFYAVCGPPAVLILLQPDLGTALVLFAVATGCLYFAGAPEKILAKFLAGVAAAGVCLLLLHFYAGLKLPLEEYQINRILSVFDPQRDPLGSRYQVNQSMIAIGSGTWWGKGLAKGTQNRLGFIPEQHTDFIFSVAGEELGFIGSVAILSCYGLLLYRCILAASRAPTRKGTIVAGGVFSMLLFHIFVNVGMTIGIMPVTGVPLPFLSYGGSALIVNSFAIGLVLNVGWTRQKILF
ncbi:MAG: rod shape-determining protein RodA [Firmicutes bacterium]|nr:rod shape-determining protein RodA [Candidatus Fermentithermobacillaceae bacterium]